jgi:hypothetical protein
MNKYRLKEYMRRKGKCMNRLISNLRSEGIANTAMYIIGTLLALGSVVYTFVSQLH